MLNHTASFPLPTHMRKMWLRKNKLAIVTRAASGQAGFSVLPAPHTLPSTEPHTLWCPVTLCALPLAPVCDAVYVCPRTQQASDVLALQGPK
jgi:hypothetical protein